MKNLLFGIAFVTATVCTAQELKHEKLKFLLGDYEVVANSPDGQGGWKATGSGKASFFTILEGTFVRETIVTSGQMGTLTMDNTIGFDGRTQTLRLIALDKEYSTMDVYHGKIEQNKLILDNLKSDAKFILDNGEEWSFKLTYEMISEDQNQLVVEFTKDDGKTWLPFAKNLFNRMGN